MRTKGSAFMVLITLIAIVAVGTAAYMYGQNQSLKSKFSPVVPTSYSTSLPQAYQYTSPSPEPSKVLVIFDVQSAFTQAEKDEITKKIVNPFLDYYKEPDSSTQNLLTLTIARNTQASKDTYPFAGKAIFDGGGNMGFLIMKVGSGVDWWYPECLNGCKLSVSFKTKYPEIAVKVQ